VRPQRRGAGLVRSRFTNVLAAGVLLAALLAGCTSARSNLGTSDSACYLALPTATRAVHAHGRLLGVHRFTVTALRKQAPRLVGDLATKEAGAQAVCVAAFTGKFTSESVIDPHGRESGHLAVVVSTTPGNHVLGTVIFLQPPLHFGHLH
jgi:hypothetical protein